MGSLPAVSPGYSFRFLFPCQPSAVWECKGSNLFSLCKASAEIIFYSFFNPLPDVKATKDRAVFPSACCCLGVQRYGNFFRLCKGQSKNNLENFSKVKAVIIAATTTWRTFLPAVFFLFRSPLFFSLP